MNQEIADQPMSSKANPEKRENITVVHGDLLLQEGLDAIVSFLTVDLSWGGPLNKRLIAYLGHQLDTYVLDHIQHPKPGDAFATPAFRLPFNSLIFGVIPIHDSGLSGEERFIKKAIKNIVQVAEKFGHSRIGIPAFGMAGDPLPSGKGARIVASAIADANVSGLEEIRLVCKSDVAFAAYRERFM